jgi:hypothetical protein
MAKHIQKKESFLDLGERPMSGRRLESLGCGLLLPQKSVDPSFSSAHPNLR